MHFHPTFSTIMVQTANLSCRLTNLTETKLEPAFNIVNIFISCIVLVFGVIENVCVLKILGSRWSQLRSFEVHIISLAIADLFESIVFPAKELFLHAGGDFALLGTGSCKVISFLCSISISVSALTIIAISIDRYSGIKWPLHRYFTNLKSLYIALGIWMFSISIALIYLIGDRVALCRYHQTNLCAVKYKDFEEEQIIVTIYFVIQGGIPLISLIIIYSSIICELSRSRKSSILNHNEKERQTRFLQNRRTTKLVFGIVIVFVLCVIPDRVFFLLYVFDNQFIPSATFKRVHVILLMLFMANGCVNPILYSRIHSLLRRQFRGSLGKIRTIHCGSLRKHIRSIASRDKSTKTEETIEDVEFSSMNLQCSQLHCRHYDERALHQRRTQNIRITLIDHVEEI